MKRLLMFVLIMLSFFMGAEVNIAFAKANNDGCEYVVDRGFCVPAMISNDSWYTEAPTHIIGKAVWYAPYVMTATAEWRGMDLEGFAGGVSLFSPSDIGKTVWLKRPGNISWEGPFLVVDASQRNHMYTTLVNVKESVEVDFATAERWGMVQTTNDGYDYEVYQWMLRDVEVYKGLQPPTTTIGNPVVYSDWFYESVTFSNEQNVLWMHKMIVDEILNISDYNLANEVYISGKIEDSEEELLELATLPILPETLGRATNTYAPYTPDSAGAISNEKLAIIMNSDALVLKREYDGLMSELANIEQINSEIVANIGVNFVEAHKYTQSNMKKMKIVPDIGWNIDCTDGNPFTGFITLDECAPGVVTYDSWFMPIPKYTSGVATYYADGIVETVLKNRNMSLDGYVDAIVLMSCDHIGESVYVKRPGFGWEGPYLVIDCSQPYHMWVNVGNRNLHIEVDHSRWIEWRNTSGTQNIELCIGSKNCAGNPIAFWYYWRENVEFMIPDTQLSLQ